MFFYVVLWEGLPVVVCLISSDVLKSLFEKEIWFEYDSKNKQINFNFKKTKTNS